MAPDGSGVAYLASHEMPTPEGHRPPLALWWVPWDGGVPPIRLSPTQAHVVDFGWAPATELPTAEAIAEAPGAAAQGEAHERAADPPRLSTADMAGTRRLWATILRGVHTTTHLLDLYGTMLGQLELPASGAPCWLGAEQRCVLITESLERFPALWDSAALTPLPLPPGLPYMLAKEEMFAPPRGRPLSLVTHALAGSARDAPLVLLLHDSVGAPLIARRTGAFHPRYLGTNGIARPSPPVPIHALVSLGYRVLSVGAVGGAVGIEVVEEEEEEVGGEGCAPAEEDAGHAAVRELTLVLDHILADAGGAAADVAADAAADAAAEAHAPPPAGVGSTWLPPVGIIGEGHGGYLAVRALSSSMRFAAAAAFGAYVDARLRAAEMGETPPDDPRAPPPEAAHTPPSEAAQTPPPDAPPSTTATLPFHASSEVGVRELLEGLGHISTPLLLLHGTADPLAPLSHSKLLFNSLRNARVPTELAIYEGEGTGLSEPRHQRDAAERICRWFQAHMPVPVPPLSRSS